MTNVRGDVPLPRQTASTKVFLSVEHPDMTPVFGTSCPPRGVSGMLRAYAYRFGEGRLRRWMTLMLADRVDVLEGRLEDLAHGRMPRPIRERGLNSEWHYADGARKRRDLMVVGAAIGVVAAAVFLPRIMRSLADE
ncbi:MAG TPA: hypothetical protein VGR02_01975 [Thermoanaerobaculia bacterium]|nr:hypothetical protein [Thermoanaerobaculia bacterium]